MTVTKLIYSYLSVKIRIMSDVVTYKFMVTQHEFYHLLSTNEQFRNKIIKIFTESTFKYAYWEFPPYSNQSSNNYAEFALIKCGSFGNINGENFADYFKNKSDGEIVIFDNLSGDTKLITINSTNKNDQTFCHIMNFMTGSTNENKHNLLMAIGREMLKYTNSQNNMYLSTHGHGVPYLHVRICNKPKYYTNFEYSKM